MFVAVVALLTQTACVLLGLLTVSVSASDYCQEHAPAGAVNGCSVPILHFQYEPQFTPSCNKHDICYHCMDIPNKENHSVSTKTKLEAIESFCAKFGYDVKNILKKMADDLSDKITPFIDKLWKSIKGLQSGIDKYIIIEVMTILGCICSLLPCGCPVFGLASAVLRLATFFLKITFSVIDIKLFLDPKIASHETIRHELASLAERLERTDIFINAIDAEEHVDDCALQGLIFNVDIHIGVDQLGNLKSRIKTLMSGGEKDWRICLEFLKMFVRISTLRHSLLFRMLICVKAKDYSRSTVNALQKCIEKERTDNQKFLSFLCVPSLENVGILAIFDPSEAKEVVTFLKELQISLQDLSSELHDQVYLIKPITESNILFGRPLFSISSVRAMKNSLDVQNVRIRFKFTAIENEFNLFHIKSPDLGEYVYMKENGLCKYDKMSCVPETAMWRILLVCDADKKKENPSCFIMCTKKWPEKFIFIEKSFFECVKGLENNSKPSQECLFTLTPPGEFPISIGMPSPGELAALITDEIHTLTPPGEFPISIGMPSPGELAALITDEIHTLTPPGEFPISIGMPSPGELAALITDEIHTVLPTTTASDSTGEIQNESFLETIQNFLIKREMNVEKDIKKIQKYILTHENNELQNSLQKIAEATSYLDEVCFTENSIHGILKLFSIYFKLFQDDFQYGDILRQLLRICGVILSCIWHARDIEVFVCHYLDNDEKYRATVAKDIRELKRFAVFLHEIEHANNILESHITEMKQRGQSFEEMECITSLTEKAMTESRLKGTFISVSILQLSILWQMYAVAKLPGHSDKTANYLRKIIVMQKENNITFVKSFSGCNLSSGSSVERSLVENYLFCFGCDSREKQCLSSDSSTPKQSEIIKSTGRKKLNLLRLVVVPLLEHYLRKSLDWLKANPEQK